MVGLLRTGTRIHTSLLGSYLSILAYVSAQFVEISFFHLGTFVVTSGKILGIVLIPLSLLLMGRIRVDRRLLLLFTSMSLTYSVSLWSDVSLWPNVVSAFATVSVGALAAAALSTALTVSTKALHWFRVIWLTFSVVTSIIAVLQVWSVIPLLSVSQAEAATLVVGGSLQRGLGLKADPNFQALLLDLGIVFASTLPPYKRMIVWIVLGCGILATNSRMGLVLGVVGLLMAPWFRGIGALRIRTVVSYALSMLILIAILGLAYFMAPDEYQSYLSLRLKELTSVADTRAHSLGRANLTSAQSRLFAARAGLRIAASRWLVGCGPYVSDRLILESAGVLNVAHNTYIEFLIIGGIWTFSVFASYWLCVRRGLRVSKGDSSLCALVCGSTFIVLVGALFLSLNYASIIWLPPVLSLAATARMMPLAERTYSK